MILKIDIRSLAFVEHYKQALAGSLPGKGVVVIGDHDVLLLADTQSGMVDAVEAGVATGKVGDDRRLEVVNLNCRRVTMNCGMPVSSNVSPGSLSIVGYSLRIWPVNVSVASFSTFG